MNMNGNYISDINFSVCVEWGIENGKPFCTGVLSKIAPEDRKNAYEHDGFNFTGGCGKEGAEFNCYATAGEAVKKACYNPFALEYHGDFTNDEIQELHKAIRELYETNSLKDFAITDEQVNNFASDFAKYKTA